MNALNQKRIKLNTRFKVSQQRRKSNFSIDLLWAHFDSERELKTAFWRGKKKDESRGGVKKNKKNNRDQYFSMKSLENFLQKQQNKPNFWNMCSSSSYFIHTRAKPSKKIIFLKKPSSNYKMEVNFHTHKTHMKV